MEFLAANAIYCNRKEVFSKGNGEYVIAVGINGVSLLIVMTKQESVPMPGR